VHLVGFIIRIYRDVWAPERQTGYRLEYLKMGNNKLHHTFHLL